MKLWIYENHICEQWSEELFEGRSSQLHTQLMQAFFLQLFIIPIQYWKERMKKTRSTDLTSPPNNRRSPELRQDLESLPAWSYQFFEDPARGGGNPMSPIWILKRLMSVFINACRLLSALPSLTQFGRGGLSLVAISFYVLSLLFGPCHLSEFTLARPPGWSRQGLNPHPPAP